MALIQPQPCSCVLFAPLFFSRLGKAAAAAAAAAAATCQACKARLELVSVSPSSLSFLLTICLAATKGGFRGSQVKGIWAHKKKRRVRLWEGGGKGEALKDLLLLIGCVSLRRRRTVSSPCDSLRVLHARNVKRTSKNRGDHFTGGVPRFL